MSGVVMAPHTSNNADHMDNSDGHLCRAVMLGLTGVGKTALTVRLITKRFIGEYCPTLENVYNYVHKGEGHHIEMEIFDTTGCQMDTNVPVTYALWGNCFIYVYSVADRSSFHEINRIKREVDELRAQSQPNNQPDCVSVLVGNQSDLHHQRTVSQAEGRALADQWGCRHCELSASDGNRMDDVINMYHGVYLLHHQQHWLHKHRHRLPKLSTLPLQRFRKAIQKVIVGTRLIRGHNSNHIITDT